MYVEASMNKAQIDPGLLEPLFELVIEISALVTIFALQTKKILGKDFIAVKGMSPFFFKL